MPLWSRRSVLATGSWLVLAMAPLSSAAPPRTLDVPEPSLSSPLQIRSAEERWQRLKNQYPVVGSSRPDRSSEGLGEPSRRIPDDEAPAELPVGSETAPDDLPTVPADTRTESSTRALPFPLLPSEPVWIVTADQPEDEEPAPPPRLADPQASQRSLVPEPAARAVVEEAPPAVAPVKPPSSANEFVPEIRVKTIGEVRVGGAFADADLRDYSRKESDKYQLAFGEQEFVPRSFAPVAALFEAPDLSYYPLYFQDPLMERYGHTYHPLVQPAVSVARFSTQLFGLPYQMAIDPPYCLQTGLGWLDPGDCNPKLRYQIPWNAKAAAVEAGVITGLIFLIP